MDCPQCGGLVQIPPPLAKTILGDVVVDQGAVEVVPAVPLPPPSAGAALPEIHVRQINGDRYIYLRCPNCRAQIASPEQHAGQLTRCPTCKQEAPVPKAPRADRRDEEHSVAPRHGRERRGRDDYEEERPRTRSPAWYEDYVTSHTKSLANMATAGLICSLIGLGMFPLGFLFANIALSKLNIFGPKPIWSDAFIHFASYFWLIAFGLNFVLSLLGVIFGARGKNIANQKNRKSGVAGLIIGIVGLTLSCLIWFIVCMGSLTSRSH
jgi:hypothetical protein